MALTATYSVNGNPISFQELQNLEITRKDYIDFVEDIKKKANANINNK